MSKTLLEIFKKQEDYNTDDLKPNDVAVLMCMDADYDSPFTDNVYAKCGDGGDGTMGCGKAIIHRPHVPKGAIKLCGDCAMKGAMEAKAKGGDIKIRITEKTAREVREWMDKS